MSCIPPSSADQRGLSQTPGARSIIQAAIFTVLSIWHATKIWALSKAEDAISQPRKQFYFIVNFHYSLSFPQMLTLYSIWHYPFHLSIFFCPLTKIHTTTLFQFVMPYPNCIVHSHPPTLILFFSTCDFLFWQKPPCKNSSTGIRSLKFTRLCQKIKQVSQILCFLIRLFSQNKTKQQK